MTEEWTRKVHGATVGMYHRIQKSCMDMMKRYQRALLVVGETVGVIVQDPAQLLRFSLQRRQQRRRTRQSAKTQRPPGRGQAWARTAGWWWPSSSLPPMPSPRDIQVRGAECIVLHVETRLLVAGSAAKQGHDTASHTTSTVTATWPGRHRLRPGKAAVDVAMRRPSGRDSRRQCKYWASPRRYTWTPSRTPCGARRCTWQRSIGSQLPC